MIGLSVRAFFLHSVKLCFHSCYFALGLGQLVCSVQRVLLDGQLLGEVIFLLFQSLELEAQGGELILVGPRGMCTLGNSVGWLVVICWGLCGKVFLRGSVIMLGVTHGWVCGFPLCLCHRGLVYAPGTWWAPLLGSRLPYDSIKMHTRRLNRVKWQSFALIYARVQYILVGGIYTPNPCYIMITVPLPARNILRIFWDVCHFIQVGVYKLSTLSDS